MTTRAHRSIGFVIGLSAFVAAHLIEVRMWATWFGGAYDPWFLNQGHASAFMVGCLFIVSLIAGGYRLPGLMIAAGAWVAMTVVLFTKTGGPGDIFPLVLFFGGLYALFGCCLGAWIGGEIRRAVRGPSDS